VIQLEWPAISGLELTPACNNRCAGCSNTYAADRSSAVLDAGFWFSALRQFAPEAVRIQLTGGEPTLHPRFPDILSASAAYDARVTVFTNARWSNPGQLLHHARGVRNLDGFLISLHGAQAASHEAFTRVRGSYATALRNIRLALEAGVTVALCTVITRFNVDELAAIVDLAADLGAEHLAFNRYIGRADSQLEPTARKLRGAIAQIEGWIADGARVRYGENLPHCFSRNSSAGCVAGVASMSIDPWGRMHPCHMSPTVIGSLLASPVYEVWHSQQMAEWLHKADDDCGGCALYGECHGGCRAIRELREDGCEPLRRRVRNRPAQPKMCQLPAVVRPTFIGRLRPERFGYTVLGQGDFLPVVSDAALVLEACDGTTSIAELEERFSDSGLALIAELWAMGLLTSSEAQKPLQIPLVGA
jgi:radical SAM protein with 4Fe4S-binding SPASM domain